MYVCRSIDWIQNHERAARHRGSEQGKGRGGVGGEKRKIMHLRFRDA